MKLYKYNICKVDTEWIVSKVYFIDSKIIFIPLAVFDNFEDVLVAIAYYNKVVKL